MKFEILCFLGAIISFFLTYLALGDVSKTFRKFSGVDRDLEELEEDRKADEEEIKAMHEYTRKLEAYIESQEKLKNEKEKENE